MAVLSSSPSNKVEAYLSKMGKSRSNVFILNGNIIKVKNLTSRYALNRGVAASKQTSGNKPQYASAGGNVYQINYYGSDYCGSSSQPTASVDPTPFTKPLADSFRGVAFKCPTVEETGYSDRIQQLTAGNSTLTTQEAANAVVAYGKWPKYEDTRGVAVDKPTQPGSGTDRFYTLDSYTWTNKETFSIPLPGALTDLGVFGQNCEYHYLWNGGFAVHVQINSTKFHQGLMMVVAIPEAQNVGGTEPFNPLRTLQANNTGGIYLNRNYPIQQLTIFPHQFINLRSNNTATIVLPYMSPNPMESPLLHNSWTVFLIPVVPLQVQAGAAPYVPVTISVAPLYSQFNGLRMSVPVTLQGVPTFEIPGSGQFMTTLMNSGYPAFPWFEPSPPHDIPGEVHNLSETIQTDTLIAMNPASEDYDRFYISLINKPPDADQASILDIDMSLCSKYLEGTYVARVSKWYSQYRGSLRLTLLFTGSAMTTGKLLVAYTPPGGNNPTTRKQAMLGTHVVWDIGLQSSVTLVIPWISVTQYRYQNLDTNAYSYAGYINVFYQTAIVYPPGGNPTAGLVGFLGACEDFEFRMLTDSAYFQGIGDEIGKVVDGVEKTIQKLDSTPSTHPSVKEELTLTTQEASALTAVETGASATTEPEAMLETQSTSATYSKREMAIEAFYSKYSVVDRFVLDLSREESWWKKIPVSFNTTTSPAVTAKYLMFTYIRANYDVVVNTHVIDVVTNTGKKLSDNVKLQLLFCPAGAPEPQTYDSTYWDLPTTPSIYFNTSDPPASMRLPFLSPASCFANFYDGFGNFSQRDYGNYPGNAIGSLFVRVLPFQYGDGYNQKVSVKIFLRPVNVRVWGPRPVVTQLQTAKVGPSTNRIVYQAEGQTQNQQTVTFKPQGPVFNTGRQLKRNRMTKRKRYQSKYAPGIKPIPKDFECPFTKYMVLVRPKGVEYLGQIFHAIVSNRKFIMTYHQSHDKELEVWSPIGWIELKGHFEFEDKFMDISVFRPWKGFQDLLPDGSPITTCRSCNPSTYNFTPTYNGYYPELSAHEVDELQIELEDGKRQWRFNTIHVPIKIPFGYCGAPLYCEHGVWGQATAGNEYEAFFTDFASQVRFFRHRPGPKGFYVAMDKMFSFFRRPEASLRDSARELGQAFGESMSAEISAAINKLVDQKAPDMVKEVITWLIKIISAMVIMHSSSNRLETAAALGLMLGIDLVGSSPFQVLKRRVLNLIGYREEREHEFEIVDFQGPTDWLSEFNKACNMMKGLDWICQKIMEFYQWLKRLFEKEDPERTLFKDLLNYLPKALEEIEKQEYDVDQAYRYFSKVKNLADKFGVERNFATQQILQAFKKVNERYTKRQTSRTEPIAILITGAPGTGKSLVCEAIGKALTRHYHTKGPYSLPPDPKYFDGYEGQDVVIMDDVGQNPDGEDLSMFCQMVSTNSFVPPMADLDHKGIPFTSRFILASTNEDRLMPPTIREPAALERRFYRTFKIEIQQSYKRKDGRLNVANVFDSKTYECTGLKHFKPCPFTTGGVALIDKRTKAVETLETVVKDLIREQEAREHVGDNFSAIFQGPNDAPTPAPRQGKPSPTPRVSREIRTVPRAESFFFCKPGKIESKPCPQEVIDLIRGVSPSAGEEIIKYASEQGWLLKPDKKTLKVSVQQTLNWVLGGLTLLATLTTLTMLVYTIVKLFSTKKQGPYSGTPTPKPRQPVPRRVVLQGGSAAENFINKLVRTNLTEIETGTGKFTGLGLYDRWLVLPSHSSPEDYILLDGKPIKIRQKFCMDSRQGPLELTMVELDRNEKFRDLRRFIPQVFQPHASCVLVLKTPIQSAIPIGSVLYQGRLHISGTQVEHLCRYRYPTKSGYCGGVVIANHQIVAIHVGGDGVHGFGAILEAPMFAEIQGERKNIQKAPRTINVNRKTSLRPSIYFDVFPGEKEPAALSRNDKRLECDLEEAMFSKYKPNMHVQYDEDFEIAVEHYAKQLKAICPGNLTEPMSLEEVVYGTVNLEPLDLNTSAGYPYLTMGISKKDLIPPNRDLTKLSQALVDYGTDLPFVTFLKDELRPIEKIKKGKTRVIEAASLNDVIRTKMCFGRLFQTFHGNPGVQTGSAVGCNPDFHWSQFYHEMEGELLAFDYSNYDASLHPVWFFALKEVLKRLGYGEEAMHIMDTICNSKHIYADVYYEVDGGMPSGCSGTSIFNSMINNLIIRVLMIKSYKGIELNDLKIIAYGDDVIVSYPYKVDAAIIAAEGANYGLTMTPPDKGSSFNEVTWENVTFLKRRFVPDEKFKYLIHPVYPMKEVYESARWTRSASHTREHLYSLCYLAWHNGRETYEKFLEDLESVPVGVACCLPSYAQLQRAWYDLF